MMRFDYPRYKAQFRSACARRGVDPARGATVYQAANARADQRHKAHSARWWLDETLWEDAPPYHSPVELAVMRALLDQAYYYALYCMAQSAGIALDMSFEDLQKFSDNS
jgi:hypothetical protein